MLSAALSVGVPGEDTNRRGSVEQNAENFASFGPRAELRDPPRARVVVVTPLRGPNATCTKPWGRPWPSRRVRATVIYIFIFCSSLLFLEFVIGFALRSGSVLGTLPEGECEAGTPIHMLIPSLHLV